MKYFLFFLCLINSIHATSEGNIMKKAQFCKPCEGGVPKFSVDQIEKNMQRLPNWSTKKEPDRITRNFTFKNFLEAMNFVNNIAYICEQEGHHANITISYNKVTLELYTHAINGLSENDFIVAELIDQIWQNTKDKKATTETITTLSILKDKAYQFVHEREWDQFHTLSNLAMSISVEAAELLQHFLWLANTQEAEKRLAEERNKIEQELSDILLGILTFSNKANINIENIFFKKMEELSQRYSIDMSKGKNIKIKGS